jgi:hypothetical protein
VDTKDVGSPVSSDSEEEGDGHFMYFTEIAEQVAPLIDEMFPPSVRIIGEPGRYFVAACATLCCSVIAARTNEMNSSFEPEAIDDKEAAENLRDMSREEEGEFVRQRGMSISEDKDADAILTTIQEELADYSKLYATQQLAQQEVDVYNDALDFYKEGFESAADLLGPPDEDQKHKVKHSVEGMTYSLANINDEGADPSGLITLAAAGEAAVNGFVLQAVADAAPLQDDYSYYINDGVYGAFNNMYVYREIGTCNFLLFPLTIPIPILQYVRPCHGASSHSWTRRKDCSHGRGWFPQTRDVQQLFRLQLPRPLRFDSVWTYMRLD